MRGLNLSNPGFVAVAAGGGAPAADITGTLTVGYNGVQGDRYGYQGSFFAGAYGSTSTTPALIVSSLFTNSGTYTAILFNGGTYGSLTVDGMTGTITGYNSLSITIGTTTQTLATGGPSGFGYSISGDPFNLQSQNGSTLSLGVVLL